MKMSATLMMVVHRCNVRRSVRFQSRYLHPALRWQTSRPGTPSRPKSEVMANYFIKGWQRSCWLPHHLAGVAGEATVTRTRSLAAIADATVGALGLSVRCPVVLRFVKPGGSLAHRNAEHRLDGPIAPPKERRPERFVALKRAPPATPPPRHSAPVGCSHRHWEQRSAIFSLEARSV